MRQVGRLGVWYPVDRLDGAGIRRLLRTVEDLGYSSFWYPEALGYESLSIASFMLANTERLIIGSSIANIYARDPFTARRGLRTLSSLYDDRFVLGLGVSHAPMVERVRGHVYDKPVPTMRRYLDGLYEDPSNAQDWPVVIAALGPLMLKLAAERTAELLVPLQCDAGTYPRGEDRFGARQAASRRAEGLPRDGPRYGARPRSAGAASLYDLNQLPQQLAANRFHRSRPWRWRFGQIHRCDGALGRCQDDCSRPESAFGCGSDSSLYSAGPRGGRYGSARSNLDRAPECLSRVKPSGLQTRPKNPRSLTLNGEVIILAYPLALPPGLDGSALELHTSDATTEPLCAVSMPRLEYPY